MSFVEAATRVDQALVRSRRAEKALADAQTELATATAELSAAKQEMFTEFPELAPAPVQQPVLQYPPGVRAIEVDDPDGGLPPGPIEFREATG